MPPINKYLDELIDYGGEPYTRVEAILDMQQMGATQGMIDRWLQGYEHAQRLRERRARITSRLYQTLDTPSAEGAPLFRDSLIVANVGSISSSTNPVLPVHPQCRVPHSSRGLLRDGWGSALPKAGV